MKKYIVAIDWKVEHKSGFDFVELNARNIKDAQIEAPATAARFCKEVENLEWDLKKVYGLYLMTQTKAQAKEYEVDNTGLRYCPEMHTWFQEEPSVLTWHSIEVKRMKKEED